MPNRSCDGCGDTYYRCDEVKGWTERNPGHRDGWSKRKAKLCMKCSSPQQSQRMLMLFAVTNTTIRRRPRRRRAA